MLLPTLSQVKSWDTDHLSQAATFWRSTAEMWESSFDRVAREMPAPGESAWSGSGADAAERRAASDQLTVRDVADDVRVAAAAADAAVADLESAKRSVLLAVGDAEAQGFVVSEDLSVVSRQAGMVFPAEFYARQAQAESFAALIRERALVLVALDAEVAGQIGAAVAGLKSIALGAGAPEDERGPTIQMVDHRTLQEGPVYPEPDIEPGRGGAGSTPNAAVIRDAIKNLPSGTSPRILEVRDQEQLRRFAEWATKGGHEYHPAKPYRDGRPIYRLPDGTFVSQGGIVKHGLTMDIKLPDGSGYKIHVNATTGGDINLPRGAIPESPRPPRSGIPESVMRPPFAGPPQLVDPGGGTSPSVLPAIPPLINRSEP
ncbi:hypothetical protein JN086_27435 [Mycolicibacterium austroafricanum]|uniref:hypothetical protein n=1 Tax=Mycolicibacterium TaxID=1866885 RepID=UPI001ABFE52C|nr:hypothetical protein [Mycolicibacterium austroafricanum]QRZ06648.1 hypothetical protein JN090_27910 [Mycolicibacterium austroafricanum]QZT68132.1 hypothetical protein JN086_27435 [Mycolicibacterium austroafricanum]